MGRRGMQPKRKPLKVLSDILTFILYAGLILVISVFLGGYALDSFFGDSSSSSLPSGERIEQNASSQQIAPTYAAIATQQWESDLYNSTKSTMSNYTISDPNDYATWVQMPRSVIDANKAMDMDELVRVWQYAIYDYPELSIYATGGESSLIHSSGSSYALDTPATTKEGAAEIKTKTTAAINKAKEVDSEAWNAANGDTTAYIQRVYFWLVSNNVYDEDSNLSVHYNDMYGAFLEGKTQCYGFSNALKYLCDMHDIPNFIASGHIPDGTAHAWNVIWSGEKWLVCDCTSGTATYHESMNGQTFEQVQQNSRYSSALFTACLMNQDEFLKDVKMDNDSYKVEKAYEKNLKSQQWPSSNVNKNNVNANSNAITIFGDADSTDNQQSNGNGDSDISNTSDSTSNGITINNIQNVIKNIIDTISTSIKKSLHGMNTAMSFMNMANISN